MPMIDKSVLPEGAIDVLRAIEETANEAGNEWVGRNEIADKLNRKTLSPFEICHLDYLHRLGFIEVERPMGAVAYQYRIIDKRG